MFRFGGIRGYDQLVISNKTENDPSTDGSKWANKKREVFHSDIPKILVAQRHVYAACQNSLFILDTKPLSDTCGGLYMDKKEFKIDSHSSPITCFGVDEASLLLCSCSDEHVFLSKWDSMLGHWDTKGISEDDGRILSCSVAFKELAIYVTLFKSDTVIVYKVASAHPPTEPGPLILDSIECFCTMEKVKELVPWSKSLFYKECFYVVGIASGNTVALKLWEVIFENEQPLIKLKSHRMVSNMKIAVGADLVTENDSLLALIVGNDGFAEVYALAEESFNLLYRFKIEDESVPSTSNSLNTSMSALQVESRILCAKFFLVKIPGKNQDEHQTEILKGSDILDMGGDGDAKSCQASAGEEQEDSDRTEWFQKDISEVNVALSLCPKLIIAAATTKGIKLLDIISGQCKLAVSHGELLKDDDDTIFIQNAQMAVNTDTCEIIVGLQSCLTRVVFSRKFLINVENESEEQPKSSESYSLIPKEALSSKSVLRKKIKSPPRQPPCYPVIKRNKPVFPRSPGNQPAWARSRSRPQAKSSGSRTRFTPPMSARSHSSSVCSGSSRGLLTSESESLTARIVKIPATGSYENEDLSLHESQKIVMPSSVSHGISILRIASTVSGKHLAFGGNLSPLVITKTQPFQTYRTFKDVGKVANVHFNFGGNLLLVASSDCRTTLVDWQNSKELLTFEFSTKFNEHVHSQFYFMDKFIVQPEENKLVLYSYARRDTGYIKLKAGEFPLSGQNITALGAANQFYSNKILTGLSNKTIQVFDTNAETTALTISNTHSKPISCIRINEAPKGQHATHLCDIFLTSSISSWDPIKLWDIRSAKCIMRISDVNQATFVATARPNISPCGRYIVSGFEDCSMSFYDVRKVNNRLCTFKKLGSTVLDCCFDPSLPMVWSGCRNGSILNFHIP